MSSPGVFCSAATWSRTKLPRAGADALGHMLVTIRARIRASFFTDWSFRRHTTRRRLAAVPVNGLKEERDGLPDDGPRPRRARVDGAAAALPARPGHGRVRGADPARRDGHGGRRDGDDEQVGGPRGRQEGDGHAEERDRLGRRQVGGATQTAGSPDGAPIGPTMPLAPREPSRPPPSGGTGRPAGTAPRMGAVAAAAPPAAYRARPLGGLV